MKESYNRSIEREGVNGLLIIKAFYGKLLETLDSLTNDDENVLDVTVPLQLLVKDHSLEISASTNRVSSF
jgi:hypothetical protein